jgi:hypothetical protein
MAPEELTERVRVTGDVPPQQVGVGRSVVLGRGSWTDWARITPFRRSSWPASPTRPCRGR